MALLWFDTVIPAITISSSQELSLTLGAKTLVQLTGSASFHFFGIAQTGGNQDGAVVTLMNISNSGTVSYTFDHASGSASSPANRFRNPANGGPAIGAFYGGITYRYDASIANWAFISHS